MLSFKTQLHLVDVDKFGDAYHFGRLVQLGVASDMVEVGMNVPVILTEIETRQYWSRVRRTLFLD